jgi:hypothetical protein
MAIDADFSAIDLHKTRQQVGSRCLAATGGADQRHALAGAQGQRNVLERRAIGAGVGEGDTVEFDQALRPTQRFLTVVFGILVDQRKTLSAAASPRWIGALTSVRSASAEPSASTWQ